MEYGRSVALLNKTVLVYDSVRKPGYVLLCSMVAEARKNTATNNNKQANKK